MSQDRRPIIIKRKKVMHGHHGGSWKIAYADFMTAMMALFLVLWILSSANENELRTIAEYFRTPIAVALTGGDKNTASTSAIPGGGDDPTHAEGEVRRIDTRLQTRPSEEQQRLINLRQRLERIIEANPRLREMRSQLRIDMTQEGLRVQIVDTDKRPMFELGSDKLEPYMREILQAIAPVLNEMPNSISLSGHTDDIPYAGGERGYSNWELSADRANASRRELVASGLDAGKLLRVAGMGSRINLAETNPSDAVNRRISIIVLDKRAAARIEAQSMMGSLPATAIVPQLETPELPAVEPQSPVAEAPASEPDVTTTPPAGQ
ncbi:flagellar motor protein MotB [Halomonas shantousis]